MFMFDLPLKRDAHIEADLHINGKETNIVDKNNISDGPQMIKQIYSNWDRIRWYTVDISPSPSPSVDDQRWRGSSTKISGVNSLMTLSSSIEFSSNFSHHHEKNVRQICWIFFVLLSTLRTIANRTSFIHSETRSIRTILRSIIHSMFRDESFQWICPMHTPSQFSSLLIPFRCSTKSFPFSFSWKEMSKKSIEYLIDLFTERWRMFEDSFLFRLWSTVDSFRLETQINWNDGKECFPIFALEDGEILSSSRVKWRSLSTKTKRNNGGRSKNDSQSDICRNLWAAETNEDRHISPCQSSTRISKIREVWLKIEHWMDVNELLSRNRAETNEGERRNLLTNVNVSTKLNTK